MTFPRLLASLALACSAQCAAASLGAARALAARVAALPPRVEPSASSELVDRFHDAVARGLQQGNAPSVDVLLGSDVRTRLGARSDLLTCTGTSCLPQVAQELRVDRVAVAEIAVSGKNYNINLRLHDQGGAEMWRTTERCDICSVREADEAIGRAASRMALWVNRPGPTDQAKAETRPPPAPVLTAPPAVTAPAPAIVQRPAQPPRRWNAYRYGWVTALAVGGLFVAGSIPFLVYAPQDNQITCPPPMDRQSCPTIYRGNLATGLGLMISGVAVGAGGFALFYALDRREQRRLEARVALQLAPGGGLLGFEGRF